MGMMNKIDKLIEESVVDTFLNKFNFFKKQYFNFLNEKEYMLLIDILHLAYYTNKDLCSSKFKKYSKLIKKIRDKGLLNLPAKLYRGMSFASQSDLDSFVSSLDSGIFPTHKKECGSWTSNKRMAEEFLPGGFRDRKSNKFGILLSLDPKQFKSDIVFTMDNSIFTEQTKKDFLRVIFESHQKRFYDKLKENREIDVDYIFDSIGPLQGAVHAAMQNEFILRNPTNKVEGINQKIIKK